MREKPAAVLIVDDEVGIRHGLETLFSRAGYGVHTAADGAAATALLREEPISAAIVDIRLRNGRNGIELLQELKRLDPELSVIMITGYGSIETAVSSMRAGAADYVLKPVDNDRLLGIVKKNLELRDLRSENRFLKKELQQNLYSTELITANPKVREIVATADKIKNSGATVLLTGESGTGKDVLAQYIHFTSDRREANFVCLNCATLSEELLMSELFGHERGAFTGALDRKLGKFEIADGGTLFLDEVSQMSTTVQAKLLRVLEECSFERVGGTRPIRVDVRVIAASNENLEQRIRDGLFREDLYYRLKVIAFDLPPLRERPEDILPLAEHFLSYYARRYNKRVTRYSPESRDRMREYSWPGNVRELKNSVNQAVLLADGETAHLHPRPGEIAAPTTGVAAAEEPLGAEESLRGRLDAVVAVHERATIAAALARHGGNRSAAARELRINRKTLRERIKRYGLH